MSIAAFSTDAGSNASLGFAEGQAPSSLNDGIRAVLGHVRESYNDASWIDYRDGTPEGTYTYISPISFKVTGENSAAKYAAGVKLRVIGETTGTIYGTVISSSYSAPDTTVAASFAGTLANESLSICISVVEPKAVPTALPDFSDGTSGYYVLPGGLIWQWGRASTIGNNIPVAFPITFPNECKVVTPSINYTSGSSMDLRPQALSVTTSGFTQSVQDSDGALVSSGAIIPTARFTYIAIGN